MSRKKKQMDMDGLAAQNPGVDISQLTHGLEAIRNLKAYGVKFESDYNLGSPYSPPIASRRKTDREHGPVLRLRNDKQ